MSTSGTVSRTYFETRKIVDHAYRRCRIESQEITSQMLQTAMDLLYLRLSSLANDGMPLWCLDRLVLPMYEGVYSIPLPIGYSDVLNVNIRQMSRVAGVATSSEGDAELAFDGDINTACIQTAPDGFIEMAVPGQARITTFGLLPATTGVWEVRLLGSKDNGVTWTTIWDESPIDVESGVWIWKDLEGANFYELFLLEAFNGTILEVAEMVIDNNPTETNVGLLNRDDYFNMPDKVFLSRPTTYWLDKQREHQILQLWPAPSAEYTFWQIVAQAQRYIQDVGKLTQLIDVPQRWYMAIIYQLSADLIRETKQADLNMIPVLDADAAQMMSRAWAGESDRSRSLLTPNIRPYTR